MADRITVQSERSLTTTVNDIEHIESSSLAGIGVIKIFFQPKVNVANAVAQVTAIAQTQLRQLPPGTTPPLILQYSASSVPIIQLGLSGEGLSEQQLNDLGLNAIRTQLVTVSGAGIPVPLRRQAGASPGRSRSAGPPVEGPLAQRRRDDDLRAEHHPAVGHGQDRHPRVLRS